MIYPRFMKPGDCIGICAPSDGRTAEVDIIRHKSAVEQLKQAGFGVKEAGEIFQSERGRSAAADVRANALKSLITDPQVRAIVAESGGDYLCEALPYLKDAADILRADPKWVQGYSDTTNLTYSIATCLDIASIYSHNLGDFGMVPWHRSITENVDLWQGKLFAGDDQTFTHESYERYQHGWLQRETGLEAYEFNSDVKIFGVDANGKRAEKLGASGRWIGGCLDSIVCLIGTPYEDGAGFARRYKDDGILWFLESFELSSPMLTRALWQMRESGAFQNAQGFVFGRPAIFNMQYDTDYENAVMDALAPLNVPIVFEADIGHQPPRIPMVCGAVGSFELKGDKLSISQKLKS
ncbi:MAG: LD-carboxypeptidase [Lachnospiraceae bacterium]|nr:LD-carboxypeptidase [Lachnospiraceae bacterium]